jgi:hypothetical protein
LSVFELRIRFVAAAQRRECLAKLAVREGQARLQANRLAITWLRLFEALLHREYAAEILMQVREVGPERDRLAHDLLRFGVARLFQERMPEQPQVIDAAGAVREVLATNGLGAVRPVHAQRLEGPLETRLGGYFRYLSNHARTLSK